MSIKLEQISYTYASTTPAKKMALDRIDLTIPKESFFGIMGQTGSGKSTLLQIMAGLLIPAEGTVSIDGENIFDKKYTMDKLRQKVGIVFQYPETQLFETTVAREIAFGLKYSNLSRQEKENRVRWALHQVGLNDETILDQSPLALSGGEQRRIAIADVLVTKPEILLLDEPIAGLDSMGRMQFLELMRELNQIGVTIVMISHDIDSICDYADRVIWMEQGRIIKQGAPGDVFNHTATESAGNSALQRTSGDRSMSGVHGHVSLPRTSGAGRIAQALRDRNAPIAEHITEYQELLQELLRWKGGGR